MLYLVCGLYFSLSFILSELHYRGGSHFSIGNGTRVIIAAWVFVSVWGIAWVVAGATFLLGWPIEYAWALFWIFLAALPGQLYRAVRIERDPAYPSDHVRGTVAHLRDVRQWHERRLQRLQVVAATQGSATPPEVTMEIEDIEAQIADIDGRLRRAAP